MDNWRGVATFAEYFAAAASRGLKYGVTTDMTDVDNNPLHARLEAYLTAHRMRKTQERFAILDAACTFDGHFDAEMLHDKMERQSYHVSISTVYSTLELLRRAGILTAHTFDRRQTRYEVLGTAHIHLVCSQCGKIREAPVGHDLAMVLSLLRFSSFTPESFSIDIFGMCAACARANRKNITHKTNLHNNGKS